MVNEPVKHEYAGLLKEKMPSGAFRYRVRVEGNKSKRIRLHVGPDHKMFMEHYLAARRGISLQLEAEPIETAIKNSVAWLTYKHEFHIRQQVLSGAASPLTLKKRLGFMEKLRADCGEYSMEIPQSRIVEIRDRMAGTPAAADSMVSAIRAMYKWALSHGIVDANPAVGIGTIDRGKGGAVPWTADDLRKFREVHPKGTNAYLALTIFMFTACRIGDACWIGRANEFERGGVRGISWQPRKRGSAVVEIPMLPPLYRATRAATVQGPSYLLTSAGVPYNTPDALGHRFRKWCRAAGLPNRSSHGIRKAAGHLLAQHGCSQYQIMTIHGHTQAKTSEVYTRGVERWGMAKDAMNRLEGMDW